MNKYYVYFITTDGDYDKEWIYANSPDSAKDKLIGEHWNIAKITNVERVE